MKKFTLIILIACFSLSVNSQNTVGSKAVYPIEETKSDRNMLGKSVYKVFIKDNKEVNRINYQALIHIGFIDSKISQIRIIEKDKQSLNVIWNLNVINQKDSESGIVMRCENENKDKFLVRMRPIENYSNIWKIGGGDIIFIQIECDVLNIGYIMEEADKRFLDSFIEK